MKLDRESLAQLLDVSAVQAPHGLSEVQCMATAALTYRFKSAHVLPCWVATLRELLRHNRYTQIGAPVGFPSGGQTTAVKLAEARELIHDGIGELDIMLNVGRHRSGDLGYVENELKTLVDLAHDFGIVTKVILEVCYLTPEEIRSACELSIQAESDYVKTTSGWGSRAPSIETVEAIVNLAGDAIRVEASESVRELATVARMYELGVRRFGVTTEAALSILDECGRSPSGGIEIAEGSTWR